MQYHWEKQPLKNETWPLWTAYFWQWLVRITAGNLRAKLKESIFKNNNQINYTVTTTTWVLSTEWSRTWSSKGLVLKWKMVVVPAWLKVGVVLQGVVVIYCINKDECNESLAPSRFLERCCQYNFSEILKRRQIIFEPGRNSLKYPINDCYDDTKHY